MFVVVSRRVAPVVGLDDTRHQIVAHDIARGEGDTAHALDAVQGLERVLQDFRGRESQIREIDLTMGAAAVVRLRQPSVKGKRARA